MNDKISQLYLEMLWELKARLDEADRIFVRMSGMIVASMSGTSFPAAKKKALLELDEKYRTLMCKTVEDVARIYLGKIALFPLQSGGSLIENMENRNAQSEELARIINELFAANGQNITERINFKHQSWRSLMENVDFKAEFEKKFAEEEKFSKRPNILVAGYTGCGKTSLIRTVLGPEAVPRSGIDNGKPCRMDFDCYENESICLWDSRGLELGDTEAGFRDRMKDFVAERQDDISVDEHIHLVWYLIQGNTARVTPCDLALMKEIFTFDNVIAVISKQDITKPEQTAAIRQALTDGGVPEHRIIEVSDAESGAVGCKELVALSCKLLPAAYRDAFMAAQSIDREAKAEKIAEKKDTAREIIQQGCKTAEKLSATPV
ncbi:MAG: hypothetical protein PHS41_11570, partial [Victivallaceae bacterium]|nr:hypothetical protein [Victivallaceae bacterium]